MKTTLKKLSIPKPKGGYDELYVDDFATKEELAALRDAVYKLHFDKEVVTDLHPFYVKSLEDENVVYSSSVSCRLSNDAANVEYSYDGIWNNLADVDSITLNKGERIYFRYIGEDYLQGEVLTSPTKTFEVGGDLRSVIYGDMTREEAGEAHYKRLFSSVKTLVSVEKLNLGVKIVGAQSCYAMFSGCESLTTAPKVLRPTILKGSALYGCYEYMFAGCTSLTTAPELPAMKMASVCYANMFDGCTSLVDAPKLPATELADNCYLRMFNGCTSLTAAPELPATELKIHCYAHMFDGCKSLVTPPSILPARVATNGGYSEMFSGCESLESMPILAFDTLKTLEVGDFIFPTCEKMFYGCTSLKKAILPKVDHIPLEAYHSMFEGCTSLEYAYIPKAELERREDETSGFGCCESMFYRCTNLKEVFCGFYGEIYEESTDCWLADVAAEGKFVQAKGANWEIGVSGIPEGWEVEDWHDDYFYLESLDDEGVVTLKDRFGLADAPAEYTTNRVTWQPTEANMQLNVCKGKRVYIRRVSGNASFNTDNLNAIFHTETRLKIGGNIDKLMQDYTLDNAVITQYCYNALFYTINYPCNIVDAGDLVLPATELKYKCYRYMFAGCESLITAPELPATILNEYCYENMFIACSALTTAPELPATTLARFCYSYMFRGCKSLITAPELPAMTLADSCYSYMFENCTSLVTAPELPATTLASRCYDSMFSGCRSLTTAPYLPAETLIDGCYSYMFYGCSKLSEIKCNAVTDATSATLTWVYGVAREGMFYHNVNATCWSDVGGDSDIPENWIRLAITD